LEKTLLNHPSGEKYNGIGGWLYLVIIGLLLNPIVSANYVLNEAIPLMNSSRWDEFTVEGGEFFHPQFSTLFIFEISFNILMVIVPIFLLILMFKRSRKIPKAMIIYFISVFVVHLADVYWTYLLFKNFAMPDSFYKELVTIVGRVLLPVIIWVPYFIVSKRVKSTFVE
jgi:hypothetical protein